MTSKPSNYYQIAFQLLAVLIVLYGCHLRFATVAQTEVFNPIRADARDYFNYAKNLSSIQVYSKDNLEQPKPDAVRAPGFPAFASLFFQDDSIQQTIVAQTLVQIAIFLLLSFALYKHLSRPAYLFFLFMLWTFPHWISMNVYYLSESLFISLLALILVISSKPQLKLTDWFFLGICLGLLSLIKFTTEYFVLFFALILLLQKKIPRQDIAIFFVTALVPIIAWKIRNYIQIGTFSDPTLAVNGLYHGSFIDFMYNNQPDTQGMPYRYDPDAPRYTSTYTALSLILNRASDDPLGYLSWYIYGKQTFLWRWDILAGMGDIWVYPITYTAWYELPDMQMTHLIQKTLHYFWIPLALIISVLFFFKKEKSPLLLWCSALVIYCILIHAITAPFPRYGIPFKLPLLIICLLAIDTFVKHQWQKIKK